MQTPRCSNGCRVPVARMRRDCYQWAWPVFPVLASRQCWRGGTCHFIHVLILGGAVTARRVNATLLLGRFCKLAHFPGQSVAFSSVSPPGLPRSWAAQLLLGCSRGGWNLLAPDPLPARLLFSFCQRGRWRGNQRPSRRGRRFEGVRYERLQRQGQVPADVAFLDSRTLRKLP